jgi:hypothetical protein
VIRKGFDFPNLVQFTIAFAGGVGSSVVADRLIKWLWPLSGWRGRIEKITVNRKETEFDDEGKVKKIIEEEVEKTIRSG